MSSLGLVAYNASDDSDDESDEVEETQTGHISAKAKGKEASLKPRQLTEKYVGSSTLGHISDEDEYEFQSTSSVSSTSTTLPFSFSSLSQDTGKGVSNPAQTSGTSIKTNGEKTSLTSLEDLPAPQSQVGGTIAEDDELEDEVKPKLAEIRNAEKPPPKKKQPVRITIPSLEETHLDEDEVERKKPAPSQVKSGLFSLLPPPMHSAKKEINRPLIPHTLTKKATAKGGGPSPSSHKDTSKPITSSAKALTTAHPKIALNVAMYGSDSDNEDDDGSSNFFSLNSSSKPSTSKDTSAKSTSLSKTLHSNNTAAPVTSSLVGESSVEKNTDKDGEEMEESPEEDPGPEPGAVNDAPLDFGHRNITGHSWSAPAFSHCHLQAVGRVGSGNSHGVYAASSSGLYNMAGSEVGEEEAQQEVADDHLKQFMSDKEFHRLSGKRKRGLEEAITFVDANVDDYVDPSEVSKHLTEESEYVSHKSKDNMPTAQQRRKKQITYLAYQAKERELELKNQWADNRMTKRNTQSKYGF